MLKKIIKSRTMIFAILLAVLGAIQTSLDFFTAYLNPQAMGVLTMLVGIAVAALRVITTTPLKDKK